MKENKKWKERERIADQLRPHGCGEEFVGKLYTFYFGHVYLHPMAMVVVIIGI